MMATDGRLFPLPRFIEESELFSSIKRDVGLPKCRPPLPSSQKEKPVPESHLHTEVISAI
jgi:hypothetical protein